MIADDAHGFTETLEVDNFALAQETNRITNFRIAY